MKVYGFQVLIEKSCLLVISKGVVLLRYALPGALPNTLCFSNSLHCCTFQGEVLQFDFVNGKAQAVMKLPYGAGCSSLLTDDGKWYFYSERYRGIIKQHGEEQQFVYCPNLSMYNEQPNQFQAFCKYHYQNFNLYYCQMQHQLANTYTDLFVLGDQRFQPLLRLLRELLEILQSMIGLRGTSAPLEQQFADLIS